ncbi:MAG TPA: hypothetical protein V6C81_05765 [Planktothrix sp.]|jgi:hypothetical protein
MSFDGNPQDSSSIEAQKGQVDPHENSSHGKLYAEIAAGGAALIATAAIIASRGRLADEVLPNANYLFEDIHGAGGGDIGLLERAEMDDLLAERKARFIHGDVESHAVADFGPRRQPSLLLYPQGRLADYKKEDAILRDFLANEKLQRLMQAHKIGEAVTDDESLTKPSRFQWLADLVRRKNA